MSLFHTAQPGAPRSAILALMFGNFVVACGVLIVPGMLDQLAHDLGVSVPAAGLLLSSAALALCLGAPLIAALTSHLDRRWLLVASLLVLAVGHLACAVAPDYPVLLVLRPFSVLGAAVLTPQAAATIGLLVPPAQRATAVTTVFLGWSMASVMGMPMGSLMAGYLHWRAGFLVIGVLAFMAAFIVWRVIPSGLRVPPLSWHSWRAVVVSPRLRRILLTTLCWCAGQFMVLGYVAPSLRHAIAASPLVLAALMALMGVFGLTGSIVLSRLVGRIGADRGARIALSLVAVGISLWCLAQWLWPTPLGFALAFMVWGSGSFAFVSAQQARLAISAPDLASASIALNSSGLYAGQAIGATVGGLLVAWSGYAWLAPSGLLVVLGALALCVLTDKA